MSLDHFSMMVPQSKFEDMIKFLTISLAHMDFKEFYRPIINLTGLGTTRPYFWLNGLVPQDVDEKSLDAILKKDHVAFTVENSEQVKQFHAVALKAGGICNGPPGPRPQYHPEYNGAFVRDPVCGVNFEVACHSHKGE